MPTVIAEFTTEAEAYIAKGMLEAEGISAEIEPNRMATLYGAGSTWSPVRLFVADADAERARRLLEQHNDI